MTSATRLALTGALAILGALGAPLPAHSVEVLLAGTVAGAPREALAGATVSAKPEGGTITTTVFSDADGRYYFPALPPGKYRVWAQARGFEPARAELDLAATRLQDFVLQPAADVVRQLTGDQLLAALPEATPEERRLKRLVHNNCSGCHTPSYVLQHRFDEAGWTAVMDLMKHVNVAGIYQTEAPANAIIDFHEKELAAYLARARGPGESSMRIKLRPRPSGEAARVVFREYDVPALDGPEKYVVNDGSDWSQGAPSGLEGGHGIHDAWADLDGNLWYTNNSPNREITLGRIDARTGAIKTLKVAGMNGLAAGAHGLTRDAKGNFWFNVGPTTIPNHGGLARLDPRTEKIDVFVPPASMSGTGGAVTLDIDGKGKVWVSAPDGALRFDPDTQAFSEFKSPRFKTPHGTGITYGVAADRDGNGWWAQMGIDIVDTTDVAAGKALAIDIPPVASEKEGLTAEERKLYDGFAGLDFNTPVPWSQGPRRMGADKQGDVVWVCDFFGGNLARIDTHTRQVTLVPVPDAAVQYPYHATVDRNHNVWANMMNSDQLMKYDPTSGRFTFYDLPTLGAETRYVSLLEHDGEMAVVLPEFRPMKVAVMTFRSEKDMAAARERAQRP
ncbi:MAG TPA: carboxypeptidase regulatory-like domain-containing protein [Stellaceae bacterium]